MSDLVHRNCGGSIRSDWTDPYRFDGEDAEKFGEEVPRQICQRCGEEIVGDAQTEWIGELAFMNETKDES